MYLEIGDNLKKSTLLNVSIVSLIFCVGQLNLFIKEKRFYIFRSPEN